MPRLIHAAAGLAASFLFAAPVLAQTAPPAGSTSKAGAEKSMSEADKTAWMKCKAMTQEAMMKDADCARIAKSHPQAGKSAKDHGPKPGPQKK